MRPAPGKEALILDLAGNSHELGLPSDVREWSLDDGEIKENQKAHKKPRDCPRCQTVFWGGKCPHCAYVQELAEVNQVDTELEEATGATVKTVKGGRRKELNRELAQVHQLPRDHQERALIDLAARRGYKPGWARQVWRIWQDGVRTA